MLIWVLDEREDACLSLGINFQILSFGRSDWNNSLTEKKKLFNEFHLF